MKTFILIILLVYLVADYYREKKELSNKEKILYFILITSSVTLYILMELAIIPKEFAFIVDFSNQ